MCLLSVKEHKHEQKHKTKGLDSFPDTVIQGLWMYQHATWFCKQILSIRINVVKFFRNVIFLFSFFFISIKPLQALLHPTVIIFLASSLN